MKSIFVVLPFGLSNMLETAQKIAHDIELKLSTYCQLIPNPMVPLSFWHDETIKPLDYLSYCLGYMRKADLIVFTHDWQTHRECSLLHAMAIDYGLNVLELGAEGAKVNGKKQKATTLPKPCPFCGESEALTILENMKAHTFAVHCKVCCAIGPITDSVSDAVLAWNNVLEKSQEQ